MSGWKDWEIGEVVEAADFQSFVQDQTVQRYADSGARSTALGTAVAEGMVSYTDDNNALEVYDGSNWVGLEKSLNDGTAGYTALSNGTAGITYQPVSHNYIINGAFDIWQRGTSVSLGGSGAVYSADRWESFRQGYAAGMTVSQQTTGLTGFQYCARVQRDSGNTSTAYLSFNNILETKDSILLAGKQLTVSFYARKGADFSATTVKFQILSSTGIDQNQRGGRTGEVSVARLDQDLTTSWVRYSISGSVSSNATQISFRAEAPMSGTAGTNDYFEITGVQLEAGSVATPFKRHAPSLQGELAACQRYYYRLNTVADRVISSGWANTTTQARGFLPFPVTLRSVPVSLEQSGTAGDYQVQRAGTTSITCSAVPAYVTAGAHGAQFSFTVASGLTAGEGLQLRGGAAGGFLGWSAEL